MPPKSKAAPPPPPRFPGRKPVTYTVSELTPERLKYLCERRALREAEQGRPVNPDRLRSSLIDELVHRAWREEQERERAEADQPRP